MKIFYDQEADAMFIELREGEFAKNKKLNDFTILDLDDEGNLLGIELLDISKRISPESLRNIQTKHFLPVLYKHTLTS